VKSLKNLVKGKQNERITCLIDLTDRLKKQDTASLAKQGKKPD
jgi:hypothetical protein